MVEGEEERARRGGREVEGEEGKKNGMRLRSSDQVAWKGGSRVGNGNEWISAGWGEEPRRFSLVT